MTTALRTGRHGRSLRAALHRNVYRAGEVDPARVDALASYVRRGGRERCKAAGDDVIVAGAFEWPAP
jgi:hypothetical protein